MRSLNSSEVSHTSLEEDVLGDYIAILIFSIFVLLLGGNENLDIFKLIHVYIYIYIILCFYIHTS